MNKYGFKSVFASLFTSFIQMKESMGYKSGNRIVYVFKELENAWTDNMPSKPELTKEMLNCWRKLRLNEKNTTIYHKYVIIQQFANYMTNCGLYAYVPSLPLEKDNQFIPYIYTHDEIEKLFNSADSLQLRYFDPRCSMFVMPTLIRLLYATGLRISEALNLINRDVDFNGKSILIRETKTNRDRLIPMSESLESLLRQYMAERARLPITNADAPTSNFFVTPNGTGISICNAYYFFRKILKMSGISFVGGGAGPRVHDLRHTFAVHALMSLSKLGKDIYCTLPVLSVFLGHKNVSSTEGYVRLIAEIYPDIIKDVSGLSSFVFPDITEDPS